MVSRIAGVTTLILLQMNCYWEISLYLLIRCMSRQLSTITQRRESWAFLVAHSMLHLSGYDHMEDDERRVMEEMQEKILTMKGYTRDYEEN